MILKQFLILRCATPAVWLEKAVAQQSLLLLDHAHCEKKAASTALEMLYRYPQHLELVIRLSRLTREELRYFEQVLKLMQQRQIEFQH